MEVNKCLLVSSSFSVISLSDSTESSEFSFQLLTPTLNVLSSSPVSNLSTDSVLHDMLRSNNKGISSPKEVYFKWQKKDSFSSSNPNISFYWSRSGQYVHGLNCKSIQKNPLFSSYPSISFLYQFYIVPLSSELPDMDFVIVTTMHVSVRF